MLKFVRSALAEVETAPADLANWRLPEDAAWIDLVQPTREEELLVERDLALSIPTPEEMRELEPSSRLYQEGGATFMTIMVLINADTEYPEIGPVTFVLAGERLITLRYIEPRAFSIFTAEAARNARLCPEGATTLLNLVDAVVNRASQVLERTASEVDVLSKEVFAPTPTDFNAALRVLGRAQVINADIRESLVSLARLLSYATLAPQMSGDPGRKERVAEISRDVQFLLDQASFETGNVSFLLDATLGFINNTQNNVIKALTVAGAAFLPPTLLASIWGMNFEFMPELNERWGYPAALTVIVLTGVAPLLWFKKRGWF
ncbi:MAG: magnesium transporter CorA family protein [Proteobacteria bacterium]|nr:magnesium transporter CorA family protein [Pseudomonadota bacterium]